MEEAARGRGRWPGARGPARTRAPVAGAHRVDRHPDLHPEAAARTGARRAQHLGPHRPLARDRRRRLEAAEAPDRPAGEPEREPKPPPTRRAKAATARSHSPASTASTSGARRAGRGAEVAVAEEDQPRRRLGARAPPRRRRSRWRPCRAGAARLTTWAPAASAASAVPSSEASSATQIAASGKRLAQRRERRADPVGLVAGGDDHRQRRSRPAASFAAHRTGILPRHGRHRGAHHRQRLEDRGRGRRQGRRTATRSSSSSR